MAQRGDFAELIVSWQEMRDRRYNYGLRAPYVWRKTSSGICIDSRKFPVSYCTIYIVLPIEYFKNVIFGNVHRQRLLPFNLFFLLV